MQLIMNEVIDALRLLTHDKDEEYMEYVKRIKTNEIASLKQSKIDTLNELIQL